MEVKPKTIDESEKKATKVEDEKKTNKDDVTTTTNGNQDQITLIKGHLKIFQGLTQQAHTKHTPSSPKTSSAYVMKIKMANHKNSIQRSENTKKMEHQDHDHKKNTEETTNIHQNKMMMMKKKVWDCESTLYDSFELNSFNRQLDSAISSSARSMSMPHISSSSSSLPPPTETTSFTKKKQNKISRSLQNFIKSMFRHNKQSSGSKSNSLSSVMSSHSQGGVDMDKYYVVFDKTGSLTTIPESGETTTEMGGVETNSLVKKTVSERFPPSRLAGISCS